jgi:hypothetical protein
VAYIDEQNLLAVFLDDDALDVRKLRRVHAGMLNITSGSIVACDPLVQPDRAAFVRQVPLRGAAAVDILVDKTAAHPLAVLWLRSREQIEPGQLRWEMAITQKQDMQTLKDNHFFGYDVDTGMGCFMDIDTAAAIEEREARHADDSTFNYYDSILDAELKDNIADHYPLGEGSSNNIVVFRSGFGDGSYPSYWGLDENGEAVVLVTDFMTMVGGDARSDREKRRDAYRASIAPEKAAALEALRSAINKPDDDAMVAALSAVLASGQAGANEIIPSTHETALFTAIRLNRTEAVRTLLGGGPCPAMPKDVQLGDAVSTYMELALFFNAPRDPELVALVEAATAKAA